MQVEARCIMDAYDSPSCQQFKMGGTYQIDRNGPLAALKTSGGDKGRYVFDFDRNAGPDDKPHDYSCKKEGCGAKFKTLNDLGTHTRTAHNDNAVMDSDDDDEPLDLTAQTCFVCDPPKVLKSKNGLRLHTEKSHGKQAKVEAETAVPA